MKPALKYILTMALCCLPGAASAQFYLSGDDPASARWKYVESPHFKVIYPEPLDTMAADYAAELEKYRLPVSRSAGFAPGEMIRGKMPVVLHPYSAVANGLVVWAPKRMDLYTSPQAYGPEPMPWKTMLSIHESRHVAQMQFGLSRCFRPFRYVLGEMFAGAMAGIYPDKWLLEGDAVVAETALSRSGRGRTGDFMNYYRIAFDHGDFRDADRWAYGSYWHYTPDHYAFGYMTLSGIRYLYDVPDFTGQLLTHYAGRPYDIVARNTVSRKLTGKKFRALVSESMRMYHEMWTEDAGKRGPFSEYEKILDTPAVHTEYSDNLLMDGDLYSLKESFNKSRRLVKIDDDGRETVISSFGSETGMLTWSEKHDRMYWSETVPDTRWSLKYDSAIRYMDLDSGKKKTLLGGGRFFNPCLSPSEYLIAVTEYMDDGKSRLCIIDASDGAIRHSVPLPDSLQLVETAWIGDTVYGTAISDNGYGIYNIEIPDAVSGNDRIIPAKAGKVWKETLAPSPVMISNIGAEDGMLMFTSDRTGVNEMYLLDPLTGRAWQETSFQYGSSDYVFSEDGEYLMCSIRDMSGSPLVKVRKENLLHREVDFFDRYEWKVADFLSRQEKDIADARNIAPAQNSDIAPASESSDSSSTVISEPRRFRKFPNLFNLHSWAPVYFDYDNISSGSYEDYYSYASVGATALFHNRLSTFTGFLGYSFHPDSFGKWRHSGHVKFTYSGLYPVIEASFDINDRAARTLYGYDFYGTSADHEALQAISGPAMSVYRYAYGSKPLISGNLSLYIPFNFSSGGWSRGLIPQIRYSVSNDSFATGNISVTAVPDISWDGAFPGPDTFPNSDSGQQGGQQGGQEESGHGFRYIIDDSAVRTALYQAVSASLRFYAMLPAAHADVYPEAGIGVETGISAHPGLKKIIAPSAYLYLYGYLPGIYGNQGLKLTALGNLRLSGATPLISGTNTLPRGFSSGEPMTSWASAQSYGIRLTADYAMPFPMGDFHIGNLFYVTRGIVTPHFDYSFIGNAQLLSAGASLEVEFGNFIGLQFPATIGVTYSYNAGPSYRSLEMLGISPGRHFIGPIFSIDF